MSAARSFETGPRLPAEVVAASEAIRRKYGAAMEWRDLQGMLQDRECVRYPCEIRFDSETLLRGEFAYTRAIGLEPEEGFIISVHPHFAERLDLLPYIVLHQISQVNLGPGADPEAAELFGATALGISPMAYYEALCRLSDELGGDELC